ncbi:MAG TPA: hypothetical protein VFE35_00880 [Candidatus Cybelea sp.]|jgi:hypothetical protein|nr:hypothetical protein [Candidatus Cybelea sp.]
MTVYTDDYVMSKEAAQAFRIAVPAIAYFMSNLARIVDITQIREGDDEYDYFVSVPADRLHEMDLRITDLKFKVQERFGVTITIMPIPVAV